MDVLAYTTLTFLIASIPYSLVIGKLVFGVDIRQYGDGNPGATNLFRATNSKFWYIVGVLADAAKGTFPVGIAFWFLGWHSFEIVPIGIVAILGHAFSPFLGFNGGKAVAITGGVWAGITLYEIPVLIGFLLFFWYKSLKESDWVVVIMMLGVGLYLWLINASHALLTLWFGNFLILVYKHRASLSKPPTLVYWLPFVSKPQ